MEGLGGFPEGLYGFGSGAAIVRMLLVMAIVAAFVHLGAKMVLDRSTVLEALATAVFGVLASFIVESLIRIDWLAWAAGVAVFVGVTAMVYRVKALKGLAVGIVAGVLYLVASWILQLLRAKLG